MTTSRQYYRIIAHLHMAEQHPGVGIISNWDTGKTLRQVSGQTLSNLLGRRKEAWFAATLEVATGALDLLEEIPRETIEAMPKSH